MATARQGPDETFAPAPAGARVRTVGLLVGAIFIVSIALNAVFLPDRGSRGYWVGVAAPLAGLPIVAAIAWFAPARALRLAGQQLVVERPAFPMRIALAGLVAIEGDRKVFEGARKLAGNDGLGAVSGRFRSEPLGEFRACVSDREHAVVLRTNSGTWVVSPAQPAAFIEAVKRRARLD